MKAVKPTVTRRGTILTLWAIFAAGLLVQMAAPHLRIVHNAFAIPSALSSNGAIRPADLIARDRQMQSLSAVLTFAGSLGLAICYRRRRRQEWCAVEGVRATR